MYALVGPASSANQASRVRPAAGARARLAWCCSRPLARSRSSGCRWPGAVLLVAAIGPAVFALDGLWHILQVHLVAAARGSGGEDVQDLLNTLIGLACCRSRCRAYCSPCADWRV